MIYSLAVVFLVLIWLTSITYFQDLDCFRACAVCNKLSKKDEARV